MPILVTKDGQQYGPYELAELQGYVTQGSFSLTDLCWQDGWAVILLRIKGRLLPTLVAIIALAPLIRIACYFFTPGSRDQIGMMFHTGFDSIAAGVLLGELLRRAPSKRWLERWSSKRSVVAVALVFLLVLSPLLTGHFRGAYSITIGKSLELFALCILITAAVSFPRTLLFRVLNWGPLAYVGVLSYSLYVWNNLFLLGEKYWFNAFPFNIACVAGMANLGKAYIPIPATRAHPGGKSSHPLA